jgi:integrase
VSRVRLTAARLQALAPGALVRDDQVRGLFAVAGPTGAVSLKLQADLRVDGKRSTVKQTLGRWPELPLDEARAQALALLAEVRAGRDPRAPEGSTTPGAWTVGHAFERYVADLEKRPGTELSRRDMRNRLHRYLDDWRGIELRTLDKAIVEARQAQVASDIRRRAHTRRATGARTANAVVRDLGAVWDFASDYTPLPANPTRRVTMIGEVRAHHEIPIAELGAWWAAVGTLKNPLRVAMHRLGLLSGLRPGNLVAIERSWVFLDGALSKIEFPATAMKGRVAFTLPMSPPMCALVREALDAGRVLSPAGSKRWLFPGDGREGHISVVREPRAPALANRTGHALRHTWKTCARLARIPESTIEILLAHRLGGVRDTYGSLADQFDMLAEAQAQVSAWVLARVSPQP